MSVTSAKQTSTCQMARTVSTTSQDTVTSVDHDEARSRIQKLLVTGDNRLKQGVDTRKARESYEQALVVARDAGLEESVRPLVEIRLADLERLGGSPPPGAPAH